MWSEQRMDLYSLHISLTEMTDLRHQMMEVEYILIVLMYTIEDKRREFNYGSTYYEGTNLNGSILLYQN